MRRALDDLLAVVAGWVVPDPTHEDPTHEDSRHQDPEHEDPTQEERT